MSKEWLAFINGLEQGPYTPTELGTHPQVTPDTLVKKKKWNKWMPIRQVFELREIFKDRPPSQPLHEKKLDVLDLATDDAISLDPSNPDPFFTYMGIILGIFLLISILYVLYA